MKCESKNGEIKVMNKIAIMTDSNSGITQKEAERLGIRVLPMPFFIKDELFYEDITLTQEEFYQRLAEDADISTSQPSPADVMELWEELLEEYDEVIHIPMSSGFPAAVRQLSCWQKSLMAEYMWLITSGFLLPRDSLSWMPLQ